MKIDLRPKDRDFLTLFVDDEPWKEIHKKVFGTQLIFTSSTIVDLKKEFIHLEHRYTKNYVFKRLGYKSYHSSELRKHLLERQISPEAIEKVLTECQTLGYLNDSDWLEMWVRRKKERGMGPFQMLQELKKFEVEEMDLEALYPLEEQIEKMQHLIRTRYKNKERQKIIGALLRKGFNYETIQTALCQQ